MVGVELLEIRGADGDDIAVGGEQMSAHVLDPVGGFPLQCGLDLGGDDTAAEDSREGVTDRALQAALEARNDAHPALLSFGAGRCGSGSVGGV
nr:hypothetical protein [Nocardia stercoris]